MQNMQQRYVMTKAIGDKLAGSGCCDKKMKTSSYSVN